MNATSQTMRALDLSIALENLSVTAKNLSQILATPDFRANHPNSANAVEAALVAVLLRLSDTK